MNKKEINEKLKEVKTRMKATKKDDYDEYLNLKNERLRLEAQLNELKKAYYAAAEQVAKVKLRKINDHFKFLLGGLVLRDNPALLEKYNTKEKLENINFKLNINNNDDISEYFVDESKS
jgi:hypothetical protein